MKTLIITSFILCVLGLLFVFEASTVEGMATFGDQYYFLKQQAIGMGVGIIIATIASFIPMSLWKKSWPFLYGISIVALMAVFIPGFGVELHGARRWVSVFGLITIQPIEFVKFGLIITLAAILSKSTHIKSFLVIIGIPLALVILQPDLGSTLLLAAICGGLYFIADGEMKWIIRLGLAAIALASIAIIASPYRAARLQTFLNPELDPLGTSFHIRQITLALGRGGFWGQGIGNSRQKAAFIPEPSSDSIFAITAEEIGFIGSLVIVSLYLILLNTSWRVAQAQTDTFNKLVGSGITLWFGLQIILNLAAVVALIPLTGMPLPFFSYGRSSLLMVLFATGVLVQLAKNDAPVHQNPRKSPSIQQLKKK